MKTIESSENQRIVVTADGSISLFDKNFHQHYHSASGAVMESEHIFIRLGLEYKIRANQLHSDSAPAHGNRVFIFEMGFGTGLNAYLAWKFADELKSPIAYTGVEAYPIEEEEYKQLNFEDKIGKPGFDKLHRLPWEQSHALSDYFTFRKEKKRLEDYTSKEKFDLIFYDAFSPRVQPELWTEEAFERIAGLTHKGGVLVTYSSKGSVRRALKHAGFQVEKHPGPGTKLEVVRAIKI